MTGSDNAVMATQVFPPAFQDNPLAYGFALFGLLMMASISVGRIIHSSRSLDPSRNGWKSPITFSRLAQIGLFSTILILTFPDLAILLLWNEIGMEDMIRLWAADRFLDGLALAPFLASVLLIMRGQFRMTELLIRQPVPSDLFASWPQIKRQLSIIGLVAVISTGIALGKLSMVY